MPKVDRIAFTTDLTEKTCVFFNAPVIHIHSIIFNSICDLLVDLPSLTAFLPGGSSCFNTRELSFQSRLVKYYLKADLPELEVIVAPNQTFTEVTELTVASNTFTFKVIG